MSHTHESELQTPDRGTAWYAQWKKVSCDFQAFTFIQKGITLRQDATQFHIIFSISKLTLRENLASVGSAQPRCFLHPARPGPTCAPLLHIALINKRDLLHPLLFPLSSGPHLFGAVPYSPPTIASPCHHNLSISLARPPGLRGLEMETGFVSQLTALLFYFLADHSQAEWSQRL